MDTPKIRCLIVDDEFPARLLLTDFVQKVPGLELVGSCSSGLEALPIVQQGGVDLLFLDIQMPDITGVDFLKMLTNRPLVVFTTAYSNYAVESYQLDVLDYLVKPFPFDRFMQSVGKAMHRLAELRQIASSASSNAAGAAGETSAQQPAQAQPATDNPADVLIVKADHKVLRIRIDDIVYIEGLREYVTIFTTTEKFIVLESLRNLEATLPAQKFMRIHKSYIVRIDKIRALYGAQVKLDGVEPYIPIGKSYKDLVQEKLFNI